jgi:hypothetical protein
MTVAPASQDAESSAALDYVPGVRGHAVLVTGRDAEGEDALAVWILGAFGTATGAWVLPLAGLDESRLLSVLSTVRGRCLVGWSEVAATEALDKVEGTLPPVLVARLSASSLAIPDLVAETREHRARHAETVTAYSATVNSKIAPLKWAGRLPDKGDEVAAALSPRHVSVATPVAGAALTLAGALSRAIELWQETEDARYRRPYLRSLGERQPLPPPWLLHLRAAESGRER